MAYQTDVNRDSLKAQAKVWDAQSAIMQKIVGDISATQQSSPPASDMSIADDIVFAPALTAYKAVAQHFHTLAQQGQTEMQDIGEALYQAYQNYDATEQANIQTVNNAG